MRVLGYKVGTLFTTYLGLPLEAPQIYSSLGFSGGKILETTCYFEEIVLFKKGKANSNKKNTFSSVPI